MALGFLVLRWASLPESAIYIWRKGIFPRMGCCIDEKSSETYTFPDFSPSHSPPVSSARFCLPCKKSRTSLGLKRPVIGTWATLYVSSLSQGGREGCLACVRLASAGPWHYSPSPTELAHPPPLAMSHLGIIPDGLDNHWSTFGKPLSLRSFSIGSPH